VEHLKGLLDVGLLEGLLPVFMPGAEVERLALVDLVDPTSDCPIGQWIGSVRECDEEDRRNALAQALAHRFITDVVFLLPPAVRANKIVGREHGEKEVRFAQATLDLVPPIVHTKNLSDVEEDRQLAASKGTERQLDLLGESRDLVLFVIAPGVADEEVVEHVEWRPEEINSVPATGALSARRNWLVIRPRPQSVFAK
jgi:hypothetical protein